MSSDGEFKNASPFGSSAVSQTSSARSAYEILRSIGIDLRRFSENADDGDIEAAALLVGGMALACENVSETGNLTKFHGEMLRMFGPAYSNDTTRDMVRGLLKDLHLYTVHDSVSRLLFALPRDPDSATSASKIAGAYAWESSLKPSDIEAILREKGAFAQELALSSASEPALPEPTMLYPPGVARALHQQRKYLLGLTKESGDFSGLNLAGLSLRKGNFRDAKCVGTIFVGADLAFAVFFGANLSHARFAKAKMQGTDLRMTDITQSDFSDVEFGYVHADGSWTLADFREAYQKLPDSTDAESTVNAVGKHLYPDVAEIVGDYLFGQRPRGVSFRRATGAVDFRGCKNLDGIFQGAALLAKTNGHTRLREITGAHPTPLVMREITDACFDNVIGRDPRSASASASAGL